MMKMPIRRNPIPGISILEETTSRNFFMYVHVQNTQYDSTRVVEGGLT